MYHDSNLISSLYFYQLTLKIDKVLFFLFFEGDMSYKVES